RALCQRPGPRGRFAALARARAHRSSAGQPGLCVAAVCAAASCGRGIRQPCGAGARGTHGCQRLAGAPGRGRAIAGSGATAPG
ncbi:hypothetical protein ABTL08_19680, partial [Acinetobacter baumannii]